VAVWYARMADIPDIRFVGSPGVNRDLLADAHARPEVGHGRYLSWPSTDGNTSASPAHRRAFSEASPDGGVDLVRWVWEGLEVPGEPSDYHFLLQGAVESFWSNRRVDPGGLQFVETFGHLDLALIEAAPKAVQISDSGRSSGFVRIVSLEILIRLLEREGAFREALVLGRRAQQFGQGYWSEDLEAKVAALDEERA
jgi:hypothetical protein